ncbi:MULTISPECIES: hybrid sensor histidine kinase/response regulator [unclassified Burkholderia]|uniref:hybrid sensor histidine kinase/response regulator n=1 Tax=unclassified Burkholderia TaxID=2613784 RepID=UPI000F5A2687|nr:MULTISPECIES: hybrid sensor histidine kinase/response regulator [unclassified Burkholderia]RQR89551.1 hybrid sensor histidine kinase/response regulator [Burkholderia sp. Bp8994]RQS17434.1 hybrid sensor histidine kinase/response regulator [Burkholderia sp. Bp8995]RQS28619.1 hybrid sensor histidine kinase/response regulator [Burkholderia sp. Bp8990]RQS37854.1 hybrid sensor histidine kinase/response regulator [Burkholderia sp. Bp8989]RQS49298.1 hybrid sensor histidine kinase/response regulator
MSTDDDLMRLSLLDLFRDEAHTQTQALASGLLTLEHSPGDAPALEACMRAAHSLKGAARIVDLQDGVDVAHAMEECFVAAQRGELTLTTAHIDALLHGVDLLLRVGNADPAAAISRADLDALAALGPTDASDERAERAVSLTPLTLPVPPAPEPGAAAPHIGSAPDDAALVSISPCTGDGPPRHPPADPSPGLHAVAPDAPPLHTQPPPRHDPQRMLRVRAEQLDQLLSLSSESLVESHWLKPFTGSILRIKRMQRDVARSLDVLVETLAERLDPAALASLNDVRQGLGNLQLQLGARLDELDRFDRRSTHLAQQLYDEALRCRMRPFGDATHAYPRIVRDLARSLGKRVRFAIVGETTQVDRDILDMLDAPLGHLLRNALDHGVETPDERIARGKPAEASVTLEARHSAGQLLISVSDDGAGIDLDALRAGVVRRRLADADTAARLSDLELLDFLLLPGFSMRDRVTDVSGRGVGLDAVHDMVKAVRGTVRIFTEPGRGARFVLQLPLTLSIVRSLLVEVGGEAYAIPLAHVRRTLELARADIDTLEGQQHFRFDGRPVGLVTAHQLLGAPLPEQAGDSVATVVIGDEWESYGIAVDRFRGECMLVIQPLDRRLGKVKDIAAAALMENGEPVLIIDVEDLLRSVDKLVRGGQLDKVQRAQHTAVARRRHVLVVDDSLTVRELERKLLEKRGYAVTVAVDGMDGWNALRGADFDLVVTDIDMPRMDGIELVTLIKRDAALKSLPVMIVSYKDREEDRRRGLDAGADYYLAKSSFHDETLLDAVRDLIGEARP